MNHLLKFGMVPTVLTLTMLSQASLGSILQGSTSKCISIFSGPPFEILIPGGNKEKSDLYFRGSKKERDDHAESMGEAGRDHARVLLEKYGSAIPTKLPILEVGPFLRPLGQSLAQNHPWIVWELDRLAAQKIADTNKASVFRVDLNALDLESWVDFWRENRKLAQRDEIRSVGLGGAILSSVLNYVDYSVILKEIITNMADKSILVIANSNVGDVAVMRNQRPVNASQIMEYLLVHFGDHIEILPESEILLLGLDGGRTGLKLAARIHKAPRKARDTYSEGMEFYTDFASAPWEVKGIKYFSKPKQDVIDYWNSEDPQLVNRALREYNENQTKYWKQPRPNRRALTLFNMEKNKALREAVKQAPPGSSEAATLVKELEAPSRERFLPEREILLQALKMPLNQRSRFIEERIHELFQRMHHTEFN